MKNANAEILQLGQTQAIAEISWQMVHDIKSPLGALDVALKNLDSQNEKSIQLITMAVDRIKSIVENFESQEDESVMLDSIDLEWSLREILQEKQVEFANRKAEIDLFTAWGFDQASVFVDDCEFKRVISNLINNAVESCTTGQPKVKVLIFKSNDRVHVELTDNGDGVSSSVRHRIFERGFTHKKARGKGLGLSSANKAVSKWGGDITLERTGETGSTFSIQLPCD